MTAVSAGTRLGPYEVLAPIGAGGMGEVFKARDTRLDRSVAIKILPADFAQNAQHRLRFEREAKTISQLNHPNICTLYDVGDNYLVMELLEGETLADRLTKGRLPLDQVLRIGTEMANALDRAHKAGIVHRDLKPGNIMLTKSGAKLLDFGLAKQTDGGALNALTDLRTEKKPLTEEGTLLGTFQYMAPEQLEGGEVDARTDIFALGAVLYEMATGRHAFEGKSKASLIASILTVEPPAITTLQPASPASLDRLIRMCLAKHPDERWQSAHDVAAELRWIAESRDTNDDRRRGRRWLPWAIAALAVVAAALAAWLSRQSAAPAPATVVSSVLPPENATFAFAGPAGGIALSPDGRRLAMLVTFEGKTMIWVRPLDKVVAQPLHGTEGAAFPFWSPDGRFIGFFAGGKLKKIDSNGGPAQVICAVGGQSRGGTWNGDGTIVFASTARSPLSKVSAGGGEPAPVTKLRKGEFSHRFPSFLPDGRHFVYLAQSYLMMTPMNRNKIVVGSLDSPERHDLVDASGGAMYVPPSYLIFLRDRSLFAQRFDAAGLKIEGAAFPIAEKIEFFIGTGAAIFTAQAGVLAYRSAERITTSRLSWWDRSGKEIEALTPTGEYHHPSIAHDGKRIAYQQVDAQTGFSDIWIFDLLRKVPTRLTFEPLDEIAPVWSADDRSVIYAAAKATGTYRIVRKSATGAAPAEVLLDADTFELPNAVTRDGRTIVFQKNDPQGMSGWDLMTLSLDNRSASPLIHSDLTENQAQLSPDGRWIAYVSDQSARNDLYIEPFPPRGAKWQVSTGGGVQPRWRGDSRELFYRTTDGQMIAVTVNASADTLEISTPVPLFTVPVPSAPGFQYDVSADGKKFLINVANSDRGSSPVTLVTNWAAERK